ncbi:flavodoxin domain-containing protein [Ramlibacter sp. MAHUQ-53]|uniref:flavodoxin domain-containing protein n=1 Tax=unclassified Ramlibacter TaxID=2617605 RepID=UPI00362B4F3B
MKLKILVGTTGGTAEGVAQAIALDCADLLPAIEVQRMDGLDTATFDDTEALYLVCTATHGSGDVPDNAWGLYDALDSQPKFLGHVRYGIVALGDSSYDTFCQGGERFDERLQGLGARRVGEVLRLDACADTLPEAEAVAWARDWLQRLV